MAGWLASTTQSLSSPPCHSSLTTGKHSHLWLLCVVWGLKRKSSCLYSRYSLCTEPSSQPRTAILESCRTFMKWGLAWKIAMVTEDRAVKAIFRPQLLLSSSFLGCHDVNNFQSHTPVTTSWNLPQDLPYNDGSLNWAKISSMGQNKPFFFIYGELFVSDILVTETQKSLTHQRLFAAAAKLGAWTRPSLSGQVRPLPSRNIGG